MTSWREKTKYLSQNSLLDQCELIGDFELAQAFADRFKKLVAVEIGSTAVDNSYDYAKVDADESLELANSKLKVDCLARGPVVPLETAKYLDYR